MNYAAQRLARVRPSASMAISGKAKALKAAGTDIIDLGVGEPDFDTPVHIVEAAHIAAQAGKTRYTPTDGDADLKTAIIDKFSRENDLSFSANEIIICNGAKQVIYGALMATLEPGEEVLLCAPHFDSYKSMTYVLGGEPVVVAVKATDGFRLTPQSLEASISSKTRWLFLNLPSNPAGAVYSREELAALGEVIARHPNVLVMSDEIYEHIIFDGRSFVSFLAACPELRKQVLTVNGVSKSYAMTGWRIGYGAAPQELIVAMTKVQSQITSGASSISQAATVAALVGAQDCVQLFREAFEQRRNLVVEGISRITGLTLDAPGGAFYTYIGCADYIGGVAADGSQINSDEDFVRLLLEIGHVAAVPGSAYGLSPFFRLSTATSSENLTIAVERIKQFCATITR